jgi:hypothetical protein
LQLGLSTEARGPQVTSVGTESGYVERRLSTREDRLLAAAVKLYSGLSIGCAVSNLSEAGAKLVFAKRAELPKEFELLIPARNTSWRVRVVWREGQELGVRRI